MALPESQKWQAGLVQVIGSKLKDLKYFVLPCAKLVNEMIPSVLYRNEMPESQCYFEELPWDKAVMNLCRENMSQIYADSGVILEKATTPGWHDESKFADLFQLHNGWIMGVNGSFRSEDADKPAFDSPPELVAFANLIGIEGRKSGFHILELQVKDSWQGKGIGSEVMDIIGQLQLENGWRTRLCVQTTNKTVHEWYRKLGFVDVGKPFNGCQIMVRSVPAASKAAKAFKRGDKLQPGISRTTPITTPATLQAPDHAPVSTLPAGPKTVAEPQISPELSVASGKVVDRSEQGCA